MKNILFFWLFLTLIFAFQKTNSQGLENFNNYVGFGGHYKSGVFPGQDGSTWTYKQCRSDRPINSPSPCLGKARDTTARVYSGTIHNGCGTFSFNFKQAYSTAVNLDVYVNNVRFCNVTSPGGTGDTSNIHFSSNIVVNLTGDFVIEFIQADSANSGQVTIDNVAWTCDTALPEPTDYPSNFTATPGYFKINLNWNDATGGQVPTGYLILGNNINNMMAPTDGTPVPDDTNLGDGSAALNILPGVQTCLFTGLQSNTTYYFAIYPYTNSGTFIDYKTDGSVPIANATTSDGVIIFHHDLNNFTLSPMISKNLKGPNQFWTIDSTHGTSLSGCAKMSGYAGSRNYINEDWLIIPAMNFDLYSNEVLSFMSAYNYTGDPLTVEISNNYDGSGNPNDFNWTDLPAIWSQGNWTWTYSGDLNVSGINGDSVYVAFIYTSDTIHASTWELDDILVVGTRNVGIEEKANSNEFTISPDPSDGTIKITFTDTRVKLINIMNYTGSNIYNETTDFTIRDIDLRYLEAGIYFVKVTDVTTSKCQVKKFLIW